MPETDDNDVELEPLTAETIITQKVDRHTKSAKTNPFEYVCSRVKYSHYHKPLYVIITILFTALATTFVLTRPALWSYLDPKQSRAEHDNVVETQSTAADRMTCPPEVAVIENFVESFDEYSSPAKNKLKHVDAYLRKYRTKRFDSWYKTYEQVLEGMHHWKSTRFVPNIRSGDTIYESACGIGLNMLMTLEILYENGIENITVYGNEYLVDSMTLANQVLDALVPTYNGRKGVVCVGDSTNLQYVPSNAFDLVYTGYLSELYDPLGLNVSETWNEQQYSGLCVSNEKWQNVGKSDWKTKTLLDIAEQRQTDWHAKWVNEMIRIAKPGKVIIIEQERLSDCGAHRPNFRGLSQQWWKDAVTKYQWDVDPESLDFEDDILYHDRYHVLMRKNKEA